MKDTIIEFWGRIIGLRSRIIELRRIIIGLRGTSRIMELRGRIIGIEFWGRIIRSNVGVELESPNVRGRIRIGAADERGLAPGQLKQHPGLVKWNRTQRVG